MNTNAISKKALSLLRAIGLVLIFLTAFGTRAALADDNVPYINTTGVAAKANGVNVIASSDDIDALNGTLSSGWYLIEPNAAIDYGTITISGDVRLILGDGSSLTVNSNSEGDAGILVSRENSLTIYAQQNGTGTLTATGGYGCAGIGGSSDYYDGGNITICGGNITATGDTNAADIGGGSGGNSGNILIFGENTKVTASGSSVIGSGTGGTDGSIFVALPGEQLGALSYSPVLFSANPATTNGTVTATFTNNPFAATGPYPLLTGLDLDGTKMSVFTTVDAKFALTGYKNSPITKTVNDLLSDDATVPFYKNDTDCGLIFDAGTGKFYLNTDFTSFGSADLNTAIPYTPPNTISWNSTTRILSLKGGFQWVTSAPVALTLIDTENGSSSALTINLTGSNVLTSNNTSSAAGVYSQIGDLTIAGTGSMDVNASNGSVAGYETDGMICTGNLTVSGGTLNAKAGESSQSCGLSVISPMPAVSKQPQTSMFKASNPLFTFSGGTLTAAGYWLALNAAPDITANSYTYWTNSETPSDPGGNGTATSLGAANEYTYSESDKFVKLSTIAQPKLTLSADPADGQIYPGAVTLTATLSGASPDNANQPITFSYGSFSASANTNASGQIKYTLPGLPVGTYTLKASFAGDALNKAATATITYTISKATPALSLTSTGGSYLVNEVTLTATAGPGVIPAAPTGTVTFMEGDTTLGTKTLNIYGTATFTIPSIIDEGRYTYTAVYSGDGNYEGAVSDSCMVNVSGYLSTSSNELNFGSLGGLQQLLLTCNSIWSLGNNAPWLSILTSDFKSDNPNIVLNVTAEANTGVQRTAQLTLSIPGVIAKTVTVTQDGATDVKTGIATTDVSPVIVYSQDGKAFVKSNTPIQSVAVYDIAGKLLKQLKGGSTLIVISDLPKSQVLIVKVTSDEGRVMSYKLRMEN